MEKDLKRKKENRKSYKRVTERERGREKEREEEEINNIHSVKQRDEKRQRR